LQWYRDFRPIASRVFDAVKSEAGALPGNRGIVDFVHGALHVCGINKIHAIVGGIHLMPVPDDYVRGSVALYNTECPHQYLGSETPQEVHNTSSGGGAMIVDK
jgi:hypothetical protein